MARLAHVADGFTIEVTAFLQGLNLVRKTRCSNLVVRLDITAVDTIHCNEGYSMGATPILDDCCSILLYFGRVTIKHCSR